MAIPLANRYHHYTMSSIAKRRRTATSVLSGDFDPHPERDVLTSLLNGVGPYKAVENEEGSRRNRQKELKQREKERKRAKVAGKAREQTIVAEAPAVATPTTATATTASVGQPSAFWRARPAANHRPTIHIATMQRSVSVTPPPMLSSPRSTPGPSNSSSTSRTSSKRPRTPDDDEALAQVAVASTSPQPDPRPRKKRPAARKGWKGWVEGSPPPSAKLINLDNVSTFRERRLRSGKNFDAISVGNLGWV